MSITVGDIICAIEEFAPLSAQDSFDNSGLMVGSRAREVDGALLCVDVTEAVIDEAARIGAGLVVSHHPLLFHPLYRVTDATYVERVVAKAVKNDIAIYAAHTNLDAVPGGMSYRLAHALGVENLTLLGRQRDGMPGVGYGVAGDLAEPVAVLEFLAGIKQKLNIGAVRYSALCRDRVGRVAINTGSGASLIGDAVAAGADIYLTAELRHNNFLDAAGRIVVADIGHFESEYCARDLLFDIIRKKMPTFAIHKSSDEKNPVNYLV